MGVEHLGVEADLFLGSERVEHAADGVHFAGDGFGGAAFGALEDHVLEKVRETVFMKGFAARAMANPDADGYRADVLHGLCNDDEAVREDVTVDIACVGDHGGHNNIVA